MSWIRSANGSGKIWGVRRAGADYLLYALLDAIVDNYFLIVEDLGKRIEELERKIMVRPERGPLDIQERVRPADQEPLCDTDP